MKTETIAQLPIVKKDPWLEPNAGDMLRRYDRYRERLSAIGKECGSLAEYANGYFYFGFQYDDALRGWWFREWLPGAKDVKMEYDNGTRAIKGITLTIEDGEFVFLVGPSGSGKSTIIKLLTGEVEPCAGRIMINGFSVSNISEKQIPLMRRTLGVIFQDFRLIEKKTVYDNLAFVMRAVGASPKEIRKRIPYVLELVGLGKKADSYPTELSGGEQQRVAIARALVNNPNTIIADEPTGNLDPERSLELMSLLVKINELGTTVVVVTHEKDLVDRFGKRVVTIDSGHVVNDSVGGYVGGHIHG